MGNRALPLRLLSERDLIRGKIGHMAIPVTPFRRFDFSDSLAPFCAACCEPEPLANAFGMMAAIADTAKFRTSGAAKALYVMGIEGEPEVAKVGVSANAITRLAELQGAHHRRLWLHGVAFFPRHNAVVVEGGVLKAASERGDRLLGEWVKVSPADLLEEALAYARDNDVPVSDGRTWFEDMSRRTVDLARGQKFRKAA